MQPIPVRTIIVKQYECKKSLKSIQTKQRVQDYVLSTVTQQSYIFFQLKQSSSTRSSAFTLAERQLFESKLMGSIMGQIKQISEQEYQVTGFRWDGFIIQLISFSEDTFLFIITNQMISPQVKKFQTKEVHQKIKLGFEEVLTRIINQKKAQQLIDIYFKELKQLFDKHPQLLTNTNDGQKIINFNLIKFQRIIQLSVQAGKIKLEEEKKEKSSSQMEIQK